MELVRFSVIVPLYNKADFIVDTIKSVFEQSRQDFEVIVVDDGSTDSGLRELERNFTDARLKIVKRRNSGVSAARNCGMAQAVGEYVCLLDADDIWLPCYLDEIGMLFDRFPTAMYVGTGYFEFASDGNDRPKASSNQVEPSLVADFYWRWAKSQFVYTSSIAIRRVALEKLGECFPIGVSNSEDQDLWFRLAERSPIGFLDKKLVGYRRGVSDSLSSTPILSQLFAYERLKKRIDNAQVPASIILDAEHLFEKHRSDLVMSNAIYGSKREAFSYARNVRWFLMPKKALKAFVVLALPSVFVVAALRVRRAVLSGITILKSIVSDLRN